MVLRYSVLERSPAGRISCVVHVAVLVTNRGRWRIRLRSLFIQDRPVASDTQYQVRSQGAGSTRT